ncbi:hydrogenase assembly chaperone HypC [Campylobacter pinnipediorum subsp. caledonicus]|uniref:Hydrogenase assembly chaperone HypC n=1 Tax=Campylobacter pinnipediorum subsp. caledonicus TaxID=1874362 RepID=A0A1S6U7M0_9BACT|nr:HypC/HybG/HupF family hydrogenase formation chaperone [Campylobacter pinnipediorum]AQW86129.1 hydrogenase assembly chaperone HypC [Campylobacter pinnipediorum subsp. caledonicus]AQW87736.1 hydrogenase assembly chaperone HypC [Campylobacter pinnipediorum subsp. caledonicus]OPA72135.1 hydrogenase formation protein [Campylobacter pinnipediorum subsp. caledonicus]
MCLSVPSKVLEIDKDNVALVETLGVKRRVSLDLISENVNIGDYILIHVGFAMEKIDTKIAEESLEIYRQIAKDMENGEIDSYDRDMGLMEILDGSNK